jgi:hypothetical protein
MMFVLRLRDQPNAKLELSVGRSRRESHFGARNALKSVQTDFPGDVAFSRRNELPAVRETDG